MRRPVGRASKCTCAADSAFSAHLTGLEGAELRRWLRGAEGRRRSRSRGLKSRVDGLLGEDTAAAEALVDIISGAGLLPSVLPLSSAAKVQEFYVTDKGSGGSTDVGDVSWVVPTAGLRTATWVPGTPAHSWQAIAAGGTSIGNKGMIVAAKTLTLTAIEVFSDPEIVQQAHRERDRRVGPDFVYESLVGDRSPPLDYRKSATP